MKIYTVYEKGSVGDSLEARADELVFVQDGLAIFAIISPFLWFIWYRLWIPLVLYLIVLGVFMGVGGLVGFSEAHVGILSTFLNIAIGLEAHNIRRFYLERGGARMIGVVSGHDIEECEYRFFASWVDEAEIEKSLIARLETA